MCCIIEPAIFFVHSLWYTLGVSQLVKNVCFNIPTTPTNQTLISQAQKKNLKVTMELQGHSNLRQTTKNVLYRALLAVLLLYPSIATDPLRNLFNEGGETTLFTTQVTRALHQQKLMSYWLHLLNSMAWHNAGVMVETN
jgi:predicted NAD/FAD-dependent oxidoreductase